MIGKSTFLMPTFVKAVSYTHLDVYKRQFQDFNLLDTLTIEENISLSLVINKQNPADIDKRVHAIADKLGIRDILSKFPYEVSGLSLIHI